VHGGQQPLVGASVYLYAVNDTGYAGPGIAASTSNAAVSLLNSSTGNPPDSNGNYYVTTASDGSFSITGDYPCPSATPYVYLLAVGGNPGLGEGTNSAITLAATLGDCTAASFTSTYAVVNELSTVATVYSLAGFATGPTHISSSGRPLAVTGLNDSIGAAINMEALATGVANTTTLGENGTVPTSEIDTLGNVMGACVNSNGVVTGPTNPTPCYTLFSNAMNGSTMPTDTATAMLNIAHNPGANIAALFNLQTAFASFQPALSSAPNDFTIAISYTGGGLDYPAGIAIDASDNVWVTDTFGDSLSEFDHRGVPFSPSIGFTTSGLNDPSSIAIDGSGYVWVGSISPYKISQYNPLLGSWNSTTSGYQGSPFVIDSSGNIWTIVAGNSISELTSPSTGGTWSSFTGGGMDAPNALAIDASGNVWVSNFYNRISEFTPSSGTWDSPSSTGWAGGGLSQPQDIAIDANANVWLVNYANSSLSEFNSSGSPLSPTGTGFTGGGLDYPYSLAIDGAGNIWTTNGDSTSISEFNSSGTAISGSSGYQGGLQFPVNLAIDGSGNVWVPNSNNNTIVEFVGAAAPVVTPIVANLLPPYGSHAVNEP
jgi:streptogramin lyase